ncbi:MAG: (2Fe-2S)-binding protein [Bacteroidales bacterium]|nr:(2Fe-2S)-binding protein [Bacteroidales bacterium]
MDKTICYCRNVSENTVLKAISDGAKTLKDIQEMTTACTGNQCEELNPSGSCCSGDIKKLLDKPDTAHTCSCCTG